ncbi:metabotropic glutamate receptor 7-like isoform X2 [Ptychodera flava]|uniref:metabotropic glutamate receptor 7-like isoform X2 n=1 Tax=Ptychodera flava TaxID=63121 RepID=UPI00396A97D7
MMKCGRHVILAVMCCWLLCDMRIMASPSLSEYTPDYVVNGDMMLLGLFELRTNSEHGYCDVIRADEMWKMHRMLYSVDQINRQMWTLPNISIGAKIIDTCGKNQTRIVEEVDRQFVDGECSLSSLVDGTVVGIIAAPSVDLGLAYGKHSHTVPMVGFGKMCPEYSGVACVSLNSVYDTDEAEAIAAVAEKLDWTYISVVYEDSFPKTLLNQRLMQEARKRGICIATLTVVPSRNADVTPSFYDSVVDNLMRTPNARAVVLFLEEESVLNLLEAATRANKDGYFVWIGNEDAMRNFSVAEGAISFRSRPNARDVEFDEYMEEVYGDGFGCILESDENRAATSKERCSGQVIVHKGSSHFGSTYLIEDAVVSLAKVFDRLTANDDGTLACESPKTKIMDQLSGMRNIGSDFIGDTRTTDYDIINLQRQDDDASGDYTWVKTAEFIGGTVTFLEDQRIKFSDGKSTVPKSVCSLPCKAGFRAVFPFQESCCWVCVLEP